MFVKVGIPILLAFVFVLAISASHASAVPYNISTSDNTYFQYSGYTDLDTCEPYDAKISCNKYDFCVMMVYLNNPACSRGVHVWYSTNGFQNDCHAFNFLNCRGIGQIPVDYSYLINGSSKYFHLPYDVAWDENNDINETESYWLFVEDKTYRFDPDIDIDFFGNWFINDAAKVDFVASANAWIWNPAQDGIGRGAIMPGGCWGVAFNDDDPSDVLGYCVLSWAVSPSGSDTARTSAGLGMFNFSTMGLNTTYLAQHLLVSDSGPNIVCTISGIGTGGCPTESRVDFITGTFEPDGAGDWEYHTEVGEVYARYNYLATQVTHTLTTNNSNSITWMSADGLHHTLAGSFYFMNLSTGMWSSSITGAYTGFGTPTQIYVSDDSISEVINSSSSDDFTVASKAVDYISYIRSSNSTLDGIYTYRQELIPVQVLLENTVSASASLICSSPYYTDSGSGTDYIQLGTPCLDPTIDILTTTHIPINFSYNVSVGGGCDIFIIRAGHLNSPYDYEFKVIDYETGSPIPNATVTIVGESSGVTDALGEVEIEIQPINDAEFTVQNVDSCTDRLVANGTGKSYVLRITAPDYQLYEETVFQPASDPTNPDDGGTFVMTKEGIYLNVSIQSTSGVSFSPCNYFMLVNGSEKVFEFRSGIEIFNSNISDFPARLRLEDDNSTLNITLSLFKVDGTWDNVSDTVVQNEEYDYAFYLPAPQNVPCLDACDCPPSACIDRYFYEFGKCDENCTYNVEDCGSSSFCDDRVGCFQADTTMVCDPLWGEADTVQCPNYCLDNYTMILSQCGADSFCKNKTISCTDYCDTEIGACNEMRYCLDPEPAVFKVQNSPVIQQITCSISNIGNRYCLDPVYVPFNGTSPTGTSSWDLPSSYVLTVLPDGWLYSTNTTNESWYYWPPLVECTSACEASIQYCQYGCDTDTMRCLGRGAGGLEILDAIPPYLQFLFSAMFLWTMLALIIGGVLTFLPSKVSQNAQPTPEIGLASIFVMYVIGLTFGFVDPLIGLMVIIGLGLGLAKMLTSMFG